MSAGPKGPRPIVIIKRKKKIIAAAHHGGAWKVAYADFVTAMMALFIVLWLLTQADMKVRQQIASFFRNPGVMPGGSAIGDAASKADKDSVLSPDFRLIRGETPAGTSTNTEDGRLQNEALLIRATIERLIADVPSLGDLREEVTVTVTADGLSIEMIDKGREMLFDLASSELKPGLEALLQRIAPVLAQLPNPIQVGGHTDARPYKAANRSNWDLAFERANKARVVLEQSGLRPGQATRVVSYADSDPFVTKDPLASENRRLSILALRHGTAHR